MNVLLTNVSDKAIAYVSAEGESNKDASPRLLEPGEKIDGHAITVNASKRLIHLHDNEYRRIFRLDTEALKWEVVE